MALNSFPVVPVHKTNGTQECRIKMLEQKPDNDWTQAIHYQLNIKRRTCTTFIPKSSETGDPNKNDKEIQCGCKRLRREHSWDVFPDNNAKWNPKQHTISAYNNAYGYIPHTHTPYIRCDIETDPKILAQLVFDVWKVKVPQLIMCIIGGAKYFKLNERLEREFIKGIIQAALKADGWIVTTGFKTGVVQLVGDAIHDHKVTNPQSHIIAIGCSKWGATKNRETLLLRKNPANTNLDASTNRSKKEKGQQSLEPNHTHFLLLDDGTYYGYDIRDYRTRFVIEASHYKNEDIPIVTIVVEGGPDTLATIYKDLRSGIPIVLIAGSGRAPNVLAKLLAQTESMISRMTKEEALEWEQEIDINDIEKLKTKFLAYAKEISDGLKEISKGSEKSKDETNDLFNCFLYCLQPAVRSKIRVYSLDSDHKLDYTIFEAIIQAKKENKSDKDKGKKSNKEQLIKLALAWNAIDVAKEHIIKDDLSDLDDTCKEKLFFEALKQDRPLFVNTFIKLNFDISKMFYVQQTNKPWSLAWKKLSELYHENESKKKERCYLVGKCLGKSEVETPYELDRLLRRLIGDYMKSIYTHSPGGALGKIQTCCRCPQGGRVGDSRAHLYRNNDDEFEVPDPEEASKEVRELVYRDLFFWSILTNRIEMSKVIMSHMQTRICAALIASKVLKSYQKFANDTESKDLISSEAEQFEEYANQFLKCCYNFHEETACEIAIRRVNLFGGVSCLQVAVDADDKNFVGQPCCDQLLNNIWFGRIEPFQSTIHQRLGLLLSVFTFGLLAPFLVSFRQEETSSEPKFHNEKQHYKMTVNQTEEDDDMTEKLLSTSTIRLNPCGINYSDNSTWHPNYCSKGCFNYFRCLKHFHQAPFIKFLYNTASYIFFLLLFSYYLLFNFKIPTNQIPSIHWTEILVIIIVSTMLIEDIRKFLCQDNRSFVGKLSNYFIKNLFFSLVRIASYVLFYIGLILRFTNASTNEDLSAAKIVLAYDLEIWFIRSLAFLGIARKMGPKLVMIRKMMIDLSFFVYIILVAMIGYGVASRSMYNYNNDTTSDDLTFNGQSVFRNIMYPTYYLMYGSTDSELEALDQNPNESTAIATQVLLAFHMLFVNILLINLLIAMFSFTFETVQSHTDLVWRYERYSLIREYFDRPPLFPPLIIITHFIELIKLIMRHLPNRKSSNVRTRRAKTFKMIGANREIDKNWSEFESYATNLCARSVVASQLSTTSTLGTSVDRQENAQIQLAAANLSQIPSNFDVKAITDEIATIKRTVGDLRNYAEEMNRCMQWMMDAMERVKMSKEPKPRLKSAVTTNDSNRTDE